MIPTIYSIKFKQFTVISSIDEVKPHIVVQRRRQTVWTIVLWDVKIVSWMFNNYCVWEIEVYVCLHCAVLVVHHTYPKQINKNIKIWKLIHAHASKVQSSFKFELYHLWKDLSDGNFQCPEFSFHVAVSIKINFKFQINVWIC